jgi:hypothetical protein
MKFCLLLLLTLYLPGFGETFLPDTAVVVGYSKTWEALPNPAARVCVRDGRGKIYVAYADSEGIFVKRSTNQGQTWILLDTLIYPAPYPEIAFPAVAILPGDTLFVAWEEGYLDTNSVWRYDIFVCRYDGTVWTSPEAISYTAPGGNSAHNPCLAPGPGGRIHCVWQSQNRGVWYAGYQAGVWSLPENIAPGGLVTYPTLVADSLDDLYLGFIYNGISYKKRTGGVWGLTETVNSFGTGPCIAVDRSFRPHIVYTVRLDSFNFDIYYQFRKEGSGWSFPYNISNNISESKGPNISVDVNDHLYVAWQDDERDTTIGHSDIFYSNYDTLWARPVAITDSNSPPHGSVTLGYPVTSEGVDVVWARGLAYKREQILYRRLPPLGSGVEQERTVSSPPSRLPFSVVPNPFVSYASVPGHEKERFTLYDIAGRKVGVFKGDKIGNGLSAGVYFLKPEGQEGKPLRIVKLR